MHWKISGVGFTKYAVNLQLHWGTQLLITMGNKQTCWWFLSFLHLGAICPGLYPPILLGVKTSSPPFSLRSSHSQQKTGYFLNWSLLPLLIPRPPASHLLSSSSSRFSILFLGRLVVIVGSRSSARFYRIPRTHVIRISDIAHVVSITPQSISWMTRVLHYGNRPPKLQ